MTMDDMQNYRPVYREPVQIDIELGPQENPGNPFPGSDEEEKQDDGRRSVYGFPFPSCGGMVIGQVLYITRALLK